MKWLNVNEFLPNPWQVVWIYWRDKEVLLGCRTYEGEEAIRCPPSEGWYSFDDEKCRWTNWWMAIDAASYDKPLSPGQIESPSTDSIRFRRSAPLAPPQNLEAYGKCMRINWTEDLSDR